MASVAMRCSSQPDDARARRQAQDGAQRAAVPPRRMGHCSGQATLGGPGASVGVTVNFSARSLASVAGLAQSAARLGSEGAQLVGDAAKATAEAAGDVLEHGVLAGVVGAAVVGALL